MAATQLYISSDLLHRAAQYNDANRNGDHHSRRNIRDYIKKLDLPPHSFYVDIDGYIRVAITHPDPQTGFREYIIPFQTVPRRDPNRGR